MGKHRGIVATIVSHNDAGCKLEIRGRGQNQSHMGDKRFGSLQWPMLMSLYEPEGNLKDVIVTVDKEGYVEKVAREPILKPTVKEPEIELRKCKGPWHRKGGEGTMLPITAFSMAKRGRFMGSLGSTCNDCKARRNEAERRLIHVQLKAEDKNGHVKLAAPPIVIESVKPLRRWKVTVIKEVEIEVEAADYLDAGVIAGGDVVSVSLIR